MRIEVRTTADDDGYCRPNSASQDDTARQLAMYVSASELWDERYIALEALAAAEFGLQALDPAPLRPASKVRRERRAGPISAAGASTSRPFGTFPPRRSSVRAEVLARLLSGERPTGMWAVFGCSTTRLADHVHALRHRYGWRIESSDVEVSTKDGRAAQISEYWLPHDAIEAAIAAGGARFCSEVFAARAEQRADAI